LVISLSLLIWIKFNKQGFPICIFANSPILFNIKLSYLAKSPLQLSSLRKICRPNLKRMADISSSTWHEAYSHFKRRKSIKSVIGLRKYGNHKKVSPPLPSKGRIPCADKAGEKFSYRISIHPLEIPKLNKTRQLISLSQSSLSNATTASMSVDQLEAEVGFFYWKSMQDMGEQALEVTDFGLMEEIWGFQFILVKLFFQRLLHSCWSCPTNMPDIPALYEQTRNALSIAETLNTTLNIQILSTRPEILPGWCCIWKISGILMKWDPVNFGLFDFECKPNLVLVTYLISQ